MHLEGYAQTSDFADLQKQSKIWGLLKEGSKPMLEIADYQKFTKVCEVDSL